MKTTKGLLTVALLLFGSILFAQTTISGKVTDSKTGNPIANASILVKGTKIGTASDVSGNYQLEVPRGSNILMITFIGYAPKEVTINGIVNNISLLDAGTKNLEEVLVVGYGTKLKKDLTGNIAQVKGSEIQNMPVTNFNQALQGRAAGVVV